MGVYRVMPCWTRCYLSDHRRAFVLDRMREELGTASLRSQLIQAGRKQMEETARQRQEMQNELDSMSKREIQEAAVQVGESIAAHGYIMDSVRQAVVTSLNEIMGPEHTARESEHQLLLAVLFLVFESGSPNVFNPRLLEEPRKAALETFGELVGPEGVQEAMVGGPNFVFQQCLAEIVLRDSELHRLVASRLASTSFTY